MGIFERANLIARNNVKTLNDIEDRIAMERFGKKYEELNYYEKEEIAFDVQDEFEEMGW